MSLKILRTSLGFIGVNLGIGHRDLTLCLRQISGREIGQMPRFDLRRFLNEWAGFRGKARKVRHDFGGRSVLEIEFERFLKVAESVFYRLAMARNLQAVTAGHKGFALSPD